MQIHKLAETPSPATRSADLRPLFRMHAELHLEQGETLQAAELYDARLRTTPDESA